MTYQYRISSHVVSAAISAWLTASHPSSEVKQVRAGVVLRWGTTREGPVLRFLFLFSFLVSFPLLFFSLFFFFLTRLLLFLLVTWMEHIKRGKKKGKRQAQEITVHLPNLPGRCCHEAPTVTEACRVGTPTVTA